MGERGCLEQKVLDLIFRERVSSFSFKFLRDPTIGSRRDKRQSYSTHRGLRVDPDFVDF